MHIVRVAEIPGRSAKNTAKHVVWSFPTIITIGWKQRIIEQVERFTQLVATVTVTEYEEGFEKQ